MVTDFKLGKDCKVGDLVDAINDYCGAIAEEYGFSTAISNPDMLIPAKYWQLVAFAVEGSNEGYYVHLGAILSPETRGGVAAYVQFGCAKTYTSDSAYEMAKQASRFLAAAAWN
jgi:hypothetical protein